MKKIITILAILSLLFSGCVNNGNIGQDSPFDEYSELSSLMIEKTQGLDFFLVDVRSFSEFTGKHIPGAVNIPAGDIAENPPSEDKNALIIVYCQSGARSGAAQKKLEQSGYTNVHNFGGISKWEGETEEGIE